MLASWNFSPQILVLLILPVCLPLQLSLFSLLFAPLSMPHMLTSRTDSPGHVQSTSLSLFSELLQMLWIFSLTYPQ